MPGTTVERVSMGGGRCRHRFLGLWFISWALYSSFVAIGNFLSRPVIPVRDPELSDFYGLFTSFVASVYREALLLRRCCPQSTNIFNPTPYYPDKDDHSSADRYSVYGC